MDNNKQMYNDETNYAFDKHVVDVAATNAILQAFHDRQEMKKYNKLVEKYNHDDEQHVKLIIEDSGRVSCVQFSEDEDDCGRTL